MISEPGRGDIDRPLGRAADFAALAGLADQAGLVTVTGLGGVGKTRLVRTYAAMIKAEGSAVTFVDLAPIASAASVIGIIATAVGATEEANTDLAAGIAAALERSGAVLVLDNLEHLLKSRLLIRELLERAPSARVVATSRVPLGLVGERLLRLEGLALPTSADDLAWGPASALYLRRAAERGSVEGPGPEDRAAIVEICRRLDGLPLAIELAAAWSRLLTPRAILRRLVEARLDLSGGPAPRQDSIEAVVSATLDLLPEPQRALFPPLGAFAGSFDEAAARAIAGDSAILPALRAFEDAALVRVAADEEGEPRFDLLETIRSVARVRLDATERREEVHARHVAHYAGHAVAAADAIRSSSFGDQAAGRRLGEPDIAAAFERAVKSGDGESAVRLAAALATRGIQMGILREPVARLRLALALPGVSDAVRSDGLNALVSLRGELGELDEQVADAREAVARARAASSPERIVRTLVTLGNWSPTDALDAYAEAAELAVMVGYTWGASAAWANLANTLWSAGRPEEAMAASQRSGDAERVMGNPSGVAESLTRQAEYELNQGRTAAALAHLTESATLLATYPGLPLLLTVTLCRLAMARALSGDVAGGEALLLDTAARVDGAESVTDIEYWLEAAAVALAGTHPVVAARCLGVIEQALARSEFSTSSASLHAAAARQIGRLIGQRRLDAERATGATGGLEVAFRQVLKLLRRDVRQDREYVDAPFGRLTTREQEILALLALGTTDRLIAERLGISAKTASVHVANVKAKLGVDTRVAAVLVARETLGIDEGGQGPEGRSAVRPR